MTLQNTNKVFVHKYSCLDCRVLCRSLHGNGESRVAKGKETIKSLILEKE